MIRRFFALATLLAFAHALMAAADNQTRRVALVIDDGPVPGHAQAFLDLLEKEGVKVTFAYIGKKVLEHPELARAAAEAGHEIVNHSFAHRRLKKIDEDEIRQEVQGGIDAIVQATGTRPAWYWPPHRERDERLGAALAAANHRAYPLRQRRVITSADWNQRNDAEAIRRRATKDVRDRSVIIFHEWRRETLEIFPAIIDDLRRQGAVFVTFSELAAADD